MKNLIATAIFLAVATSCTQISPYKSWECHHSIAHVMEWRGNCVIYEAILEQARQLQAMGARPWFVRMNNETLNSLADEGKAERIRLQGGGSLWLVDSPGGSLRCVLDIRLDSGQIIVGRGWDVKRVEEQVEEEGRPVLVSQSEDVEF